MHFSVDDSAVVITDNYIWLRVILASESIDRLLLVFCLSDCDFIAVRVGKLK